MPEGPEVEVIRLGLSEIIGMQVKKMVVSNHKKYQNLKKYQNIFSNFTLTNIERKGKFLIWIFQSPKDTLYGLNHLGMTGLWHLYSPKTWKRDFGNLSSFKHYKLYFEFSNGLHLLFSDARTFGRFEIYQDERIFELPSIKKLGPDILDKKFDVIEFSKRLLGSKKNKTIQVGKALLDPKIVAGCGNIYKNEALFYAKINPFLSVQDLNASQIQHLAEGLSKVGDDALKNKGTTLRDYTHVDGYSGLMQNHLKVYGRDSQPCYNCTGVIESAKQGDRTSFWCNFCQPLG